MFIGEFDGLFARFGGADGDIGQGHFDGNSPFAVLELLSMLLSLTVRWQSTGLDAIGHKIHNFQ